LNEQHWTGGIAILWQIYLQSTDSLHKLHLNLNDSTYTSLARHSCENFFTEKHQGPKLTFLGRPQLATEIFFSCQMEKCKNKFSLLGETQKKCENIATP